MGVISEEEAGAPFASTTFSTPAVYEPQATNDEEFHSWADAIPQAAGLYDPREEKDACGVGFLVQIKGVPSHKILAEGKFLLCNMTHRGAVGADARDGDGAGVMCGIPHDFYASQVESAFRVKLPPKGQYAVGNLFFKPERSVRQECKEKFEEIAESLGLTIMCWRPVPRDNSILGPASKSKEPVVEQPFVTVANQDPKAEFDYAKFEHTLYLLRKQSIHAIGFKKWYYICSLSNKNIIYKGLLSPVQVYSYFKDLTEPEFKTHFALVHSRFSTNTFPSWDRAQPMRWCAHNGEINTLRGNKNWMRAREGVMHSDSFPGQLINSLFPVIEEGGSDSAAFDNVLELLTMSGVFSMPQAVMMMIPEAWQDHPEMESYKREFYEWSACLMEPWDGPALITFADGRYVGAVLDRNGLRPARYYVTDEDIMICASEVGTVKIAPETVTMKGRLQPGKMLLVDTEEGRIVDDAALKKEVATLKPFGEWIQKNMFSLEDVTEWAKRSGRLKTAGLDPHSVSQDPRMRGFGFSIEQLNMLIQPMVNDGKEALGSMGNDQPLACMSQMPRLIYEYFKQLFAQVTNPPIDPIREEIVMSLGCYVGPEGNLLEMAPEQVSRMFLPAPIISREELSVIKQMERFKAGWKVAIIDITFSRSEGREGYLLCLDRVCAEVSRAISDGYKIAILSDANTGPERVPISAAIAMGGVHHYLVRNKQRSRIAIMVETAEAREVHHFCVLLGYGADAICPYLALESMIKLRREGLLPTTLTEEKIVYNYKKAANNGILKVMSKMGISTLQSYKGAQIFEAVGIDSSVVSRCFAGTASRIKGIGFDVLALDALTYHEYAWPTRETVVIDALPEASDYHWRNGGENHMNSPLSIANLQDAVRRKNQDAYDAYSREVQEQVRNSTLRGMLDFKTDHAVPVPLDEVEPWSEIVKRFCTGAMSYGSISWEAHTTLAMAMNKLGGKSNTGEGGEDPERSSSVVNGYKLRSAIKQVASARFGVTSFYLADADELQIKMAQGAKPGEGGELPGHKVSQDIGKTRKSTPGVGLISPPPHHDIYSIEDLKQLIYDLKCSNPTARVSVKLVSEVGVGIVASGVAKAKADHILISGHDGGTGASRWTGIKYAGLPWELGLAETHQTLVLNDLRGRVVVQTDGQLKSGRDVAIACLLGAEEWGFATAPLIAMGCTMMRKCHLNTCPVGVATQDADLRKKFAGEPEHVINFFYYIAEELRKIMASLGMRTINEMVGRTDLLTVNPGLKNPKTRNLDLSPILVPAFSLRPNVATYNVSKQNHQLEKRLDNKLIEAAKSALESRKPVVIDAEVVNTDRALGTTLSYNVAKTFGEDGLPENTIHVKVKGSAGQSMGAFLSSGITIELEGDANDYVGKGLSGGKLIIYPPKVSKFKAEENIIIGNVCLYGATSGKAFFNGVAAERFAVRNSGAISVVEGVGDHGCEYMTGGRVIILGGTGRNFAAGMSGGIAYVLDVDGKFKSRVNTEMVLLETFEDQTEIDYIKSLIAEHLELTGSPNAKNVLDNWAQMESRFVKVYPEDYKAVLEAAKKAALEKPAEKPVEEAAPVPTPANGHANGHHHEAHLDDIEESMPDVQSMKKRQDVIDKVNGFVKYKRATDPYRNPRKRVKDWKEINARLDVDDLRVQAARCMDCGVPFCQSDTGCPIGNIIPKWNDLVYKNQWQEALERLLMTNNFPEFTGRVCPAPCEGACVLGINEPPVSIKSLEAAIIDRAFEEGWIVPTPPKFRTGKRIAIIGSGPAGLSAADQLNKAGHTVTVYDRNDRIGGLLMYGIPNMKLDKRIVQRRVDLMAAEGVEFVPNAYVGKNIDGRKLKAENDVVLICTGATWPRDLNIPGRDLNGIHFAMEFLQKNTASLLDSELTDDRYLNAKDKDVIVIGGGDTGNDCIGTSVRHGARSVVNFELLPQPPMERAPDNPWPQFPRVFKVDYGHAEVSAMHGADPREFCILSKEFIGDGNGNLTGVNTVRVEWTKDERGNWRMKEIPGSEKVFKADMIMLSMGFMGPENDVLKQLNVKQDARTNIATPKGSYRTFVEGVFAAGDCRRGQSLIVWGINEGRQAAREIDIYLMGNTRLPVTGGIEQRPVESLEVMNLVETDTSNKSH